MTHLLKLACLLLVTTAGCPSGSTDDPNADPSTDPKDAALPEWLDGRWQATAISLGETVTGCVTIEGGRVTRWGSACSSGEMRLVSAPVAQTTASGVLVEANVLPDEGGARYITMQLRYVSDDLLSGTITTIGVGMQPFIGTVTLARG